MERPDPGILVVDGVLSATHQATLLGALDVGDMSGQLLGSSGLARTRRRGESRSIEVPQLLWSTLGPLLPPPGDWFPPTRTRPSLEPDIDQWRWDGCNVLTRFYEYGLGDEFRPHTDESWRASTLRRSLLTILVYLPAGDECLGGETVVEGHVIDPVPGRVAVFDHRLTHAGQPVLRGRKVVLRNDVMAAAGS